jgi:hypothetical protein
MEPSRSFRHIIKLRTPPGDAGALPLAKRTTISGVPTTIRVATFLLIKPRPGQRPTHMTMKVVGTAGIALAGRWTTVGGTTATARGRDMSGALTLTKRITVEAMRGAGGVDMIIRRRDMGVRGTGRRERHLSGGHAERGDDDFHDHLVVAACASRFVFSVGGQGRRCPVDVPEVVYFL